MRLKTEKVKKIMKEREVTKEMLTAICGIECIEDDRFIAPAHARKLSRVLGVDVAEITAEIQEGGSHGITRLRSRKHT